MRAQSPDRGKRKVVVIAGALFCLIAASLALPRWWGGPARDVNVPAANSTATTQQTPSKEYIYVGGRLIAIEAPSSSVGEPPASFNLLATAESSTKVVLRWTAPTSPVTRYQVERKQGGGDFIPLNSNLRADSLGFDDNTAEGGKAYVYRVLAFPPDTASPPAYSNRDLATTLFFTDDPLVPKQTTIRALHVAELRIAVGAVRATAGLTEAAWSLPGPQVNGRIYAAHVQDLRDNLDSALVGLQLPTPPPYNPDPAAISSGLTVKAAHIQQIRDRVK